MAARKKARSKQARLEAPRAVKKRQKKTIAAKSDDRQSLREESVATDEERLPPEAAVTERESGEPAAHADHRSRTQESRIGFPIVGVGASAGGLTALGLLLDAMPPETGMAFVLIQHLDPTKASLTAELLAHRTKMKVAEVQDATRVHPNCVYVMPPGKHISISNGALRLTDPPTPGARRLPIDFFFRSLGEEMQERAIAIVLSGTGADGAMGIKAIRAHGGITIVQDPQTAAHQGMPRSAIATDVVDCVLPIERIPEVIAGYPQLPHVSGALERVQEPSIDLDAILALIGARTKYDFRAYKKNTIARRVSRRMCLLEIQDIEEYLVYLREDQGEIDALVKDLLISVTGFFRDRAAWEELEELVIGPLVARKYSDETIRVWVPGCATGDDAYSVAMMLIEHLQKAQKSCRLQIFATDIDMDALEHARSGGYADSMVATVPPEYLERFFIEERGGSHYEVTKALREAVVFAEQNLISDPPFSRLDLICCRNVMIYLEAEVQAKLIGLYYYALVEEGCLFLGSAETAGGQDDLFRVLSPTWRIYRRTSGLRMPLVELPITVDGPRRELAPVSEHRPHGLAHLVKLAEHRLMEEFGPAAVLIDPGFHILYFYGRTDDYLTQLYGLPSLNLLERVREGLRSKLRIAVPEAIRERHIVSVAAQVRRGRHFHPCRIRVVPVGQSIEEENWLLIVFDGPGAGDEYRDRSAASVEGPPRAARPDHGDAESVIRDLERDLSATRQELRTTIDELAAANVQFKVSNEGMMSINEELQSLNEELETSKEELQSLNEELSTVNAQLAAKLGELQAKNDDLNNLMTSTAVATLCLDAEYCIRWFTPALKDLVRLVDSDVGRPFGNFAHSFTEQRLMQAAQDVSMNLEPQESEVQTLDGRWFIQMVRSYRTADHRVNGVVITFTDITHRKQLEQQQEVITRSLEDQVGDRVKSLRILQSITRAANEASTVEQAMHAALEEICKHGGWTLGHVLQWAEDDCNTMASSGIWFVSGDDRFDDFRQLSAQTRFASGEGMLGRVVETRQPIWVDDLRTLDDWRGGPDTLSLRSALAFPITVGDQVVAVLELLSDHTIEREDRLLELIPDVGMQLGHLIERKQLEKQIADGVDQEQRRIGQELHDSLGQELTAVAYMTSNLRELLAAVESTEVTRVDRLIKAVDGVREKVVSLAKGLLPEIDAEGLAAAIEQLMRETGRTYEIECILECDAPVRLGDRFKATQFYRIAQEAVHNAIKHARAQRIVVRLTDDPALQLEIRDDGVGMAEAPGDGSGLRIMRHRADLIGARLSVESNPGSGTVVTATMQKLNG